VLIAYGTNDVGGWWSLIQGDNPDVNYGIGQIIGSYKAVMAEAENRGMLPIVAKAPPPATPQLGLCDDSANNPSDPLNATWVQNISAMSDRVVLLNQALEANFHIAGRTAQLFGFNPAINNTLLRDCLHLTNEGEAARARSAFSYLLTGQ
jgi:lysophospholipase L1-like esterase